MRVSELLGTFWRSFSDNRKSRRQSRSFRPHSAEILEHRQLLTAQITQIGDLNVAVETGGSDPQQLTQIGNTLYFTAVDKTHGRELWKKEGTNAAVLVKDIFPGQSGAAPENLTAFGSTLYFNADDGISGRELWKSDGTAAGTVQITEFLASDPSQFDTAYWPFNLHAVNDKLYFEAFHEAGNPNPTQFVSDGTTAGTHRLVDGIFNTPFRGVISNSRTQLGNLFLFDAYGLHATDGTSAGTQYLVGGYNNWAGELTTIGSTAYFAMGDATNGRELWKTDGTPAGTVMIKDILPGDSSSPEGLANVNGTLYFSAVGFDGTINRHGLWKSDGTAAGTVRVRDFDVRPRYITAIGSTAYFEAPEPGTGIRRLWKTDGTTAGTVIVSTDFQDPQSLVNVNGKLYFSAFTAASGRELWASDGTAAGTALYREGIAGTTGSQPELLKNVSGALYYSAIDGVKGRELWRHDLTTNTATINDIFRGTQNSGVSNFISAGNNVFFVWDKGDSAELWKCAANGTGATMLRSHSKALNIWGIQDLTSFKGSVYYTTFDASSQVELWKSDGTVAGTALFKEINQTAAASGNSNPSSLTVVNDTMYFSAFDANGRELWKTDGTAAGTVMVKDIAPGTGDTIQYQAPMGAIGSTLYFFANDGVSGFELWKTDGTAAGTTMVKDINPGINNSSLHQPFHGRAMQIISVGNLVYFTSDDGVNGFELWQSDGTAAGTSQVIDLWQSFGDSVFIRSMTNANGKLYFVYAPLSPLARPGDWNLACRPTPTSPLTVISQFDADGIRRQFVNPLTAIGGDVYFNAPDGVAGNELWKSDGTSAGTVMVKDIFSVPPSVAKPYEWSSDPQSIVASNGMLFFSAYTPANGRELWMSDGTTAGTTLLADLTGDSGSSSPENLMAVNGRVFMTAMTEALGREPVTVIDVFTPSAPTVLTPSGTTPAQRPSFTWTASAGAVSYDVFIKNNATGANPQVSINVTGTSWLPTADLGIGKFSVWVRAVSASGTKSAWSAQKDFTVNTPATTAVMIRNQSTSRPKVNWNDLTGAVKYDVWLDSTTAGQVSTVILHDIRGKSWQSGTDLALGSYRVWVRGLDASGLAAAWSPVVNFNVSTSPVMTAPLSSTFERRPQFTWNAVPSATKYDIYIRNMDTETVAFSQANIAATNWTPPSDLPDGHYRWQVVAASANARGLWSNLVDFTIGGQPEILTPTGSTTNAKPPITWKAVSGAATYQVWVDRADTWVQGVINVSGITGTSFTPTNALAAGTYRVWVRAISSTGAFSAWSDFQTFQIT